MFFSIFPNSGFSVKNGVNTGKQGRAATLARTPVFRHPTKPRRKAAQTRHAALVYTSSANAGKRAHGQKNRPSVDPESLSLPALGLAKSQGLPYGAPALFW